MTDQPIAVFTDVEDTDISPAVAMLELAGFETRVLRTRDPQKIIAGAAGAQALLPGYSEITREVIEALTDLRIISLMSMGTDSVDIEAANEYGIWVTNVPGAATEEVATHTLATVLAHLRRLPFYTASANPTDWNARSAVAPRRVSELTLGIIGLGRIGRELARQASALFGSIIGSDPYLPDTEAVRTDLDSLGVRRASLDEVRSSADVLSLHLPLTADTEKLVDSEFLDGMAENALIVNVSRGAIIDHAALAVALDSGRLAGACLDVLDMEPPSSDHPMLGREEVLLTPHIAYFSDRTAAEYLRIQAQNAITLFETGQPESPVNAPVARSEGKHDLT
ncbi:C-terminal binding protein [Brevibacterium renqingii]|uniref:C-terminal binding protein n=1 Tax=Brevibacterium renqingii TaxID=2776916 RepID=UPI001ADED8F0|nr:C-terminal binding protein [Brevibacterium renqingii]